MEALFGILGTLLGSLGTAWLQYRYNLQGRRVEVALQQRQADQAKQQERRELLKTLLMEFVRVTDPEYPGQLDKNISEYIIPIQLHLDIEQPIESRMNDRLNKLALDKSGALPCDPTERLHLHGQLVDLARDFIVRTVYKEPPPKQRGPLA